MATSDEDLGGLSGVAIRRPVFTTMVMLGLVVLGLFSYRRLPIDQFPDVDIPVVSVQTVYPGASSETIEREVTRRMEEAFNPVEGVDRITSISLEGVSQVIVEFDLGRDVDVASQDIRAKIEGDPPRPAGGHRAADRAEVRPVGAADHLARARRRTTQPIDRADGRSPTRRSAARLETARGVGEVRIAGGLEREIRVNLHPDAAAGARRHRARGDGRAAARRTWRCRRAASRAARREQLVRVTGRITDPRAVRRRHRRHAQRPARAAARRRAGGDGHRGGAVGRARERRARRVARHPQGVAARTRWRWPTRVKARDRAACRRRCPRARSCASCATTRSRSGSRSSDVIHELLLGALLTIIIVMLFLNDWKATAITSLALPVSVISSFILMDVLGFTLNMLTLMALSLSIGILIDDAIVVVENIVRHREKGEDHFTAAAQGHDARSSSPSWRRRSRSSRCSCPSRSWAASSAASSSSSA